MKVCADCFNDEEIQNYIDAVGVMGMCDVLKKNAIVIDLEELNDFFLDVFSIFKTVDTSKFSVSDFLQKDWKLFADTVISREIIRECAVCLGVKIDITHVTYIDYIAEYVNIWQRLKHDLQYESRFMINLNLYNPTDPFLRNCLNANDVLIKLPKGTILYRARVLPDKVSYYKKEDLGCPPPYMVCNGRANPIGIPYLYLCDNKETTYYEVRARYKDRLAIGDFQIKKDLKIVALTSLYSLYLSSHSGDFIEDIKHKLLLHYIAEDMSKPLSRYDTELDYVPTQFICELCKINKADGISFKSSLDKKGINYVLFSVNEDIAECIKVKNISIEHVEINSLPLTI